MSLLLNCFDNGSNVDQDDAMRFGDSGLALAIVACVAIGPARVDAQVRLIGDPADVDWFEYREREYVVDVSR